LLPSVSPTIDWVRLPQRFPVRIQVDGSAPIELRIGQTVSVAISHGPQSPAFHNRLTSITFGRLPTQSDR
jgi:multidrug resistance efflux pump